MDTAILPSTLLLTVLLSVGLFFFIRASTKDRLEIAQLVSEQDEAALLPQLQEYFRLRILPSGGGRPRKKPSDF